MMIRKYIFIVMMAMLAAGGTPMARAWAQSLNAVSNGVAQTDGLETTTSAEVAATQILKTTLDTLDVQEMDIQEVLKRIAFQSGLEIISDEDISARVTIYLKDVDVFDALRIILDTNNLAYSQDPPPAAETQGGQGAAVHVMTAQSFESRFGYPFSQKV